MISRLFQFFETLVDPYTAYPDTDTPPRRLFAFLWDYSQPFKTLFAATAIMSLVVAAIEIGLIWYMGRVVDLLSTGAPSEVLADQRGRADPRGAFRPSDPAPHARPRCHTSEQRDPAAVRHADPLARASAGPAPVGGLVRERFRGPHRQPDHADPAERRRGGVSRSSTRSPSRSPTSLVRRSCSLGRIRACFFRFWRGSRFTGCCCAGRSCGSVPPRRPAPMCARPRRGGSSTPTRTSMQ